MKIKCLSLIPASCLSVASLFALTAPSQAFTINGGFEDDLSNGWSTIGDVSRVGTFNGIAPTSGSFQALLNTGSNLDGEEQYAAAPVASLDLETFLGLNAGALGLDAFEGSGLKQSFSLSTDSYLTFNWQFLGESSFPDNAFLVINGNQISLATAPGTTGLQTYQTTLAAGNYIVGLGIIDRGDFTGASQFLVDGGTTAAVPTPPTVLATLLGGGIMAFKRWRQQRRSQA
jgi:hypothetical protein